MAERKRVDFDETVFVLDVDGSNEGRIRIWRERSGGSISVRIDGLPRSSVSASLAAESTITVDLQLSDQVAKQIGYELVEVAR